MRLDLLVSFAAGFVTFPVVCLLLLFAVFAWLWFWEPDLFPDECSKSIED